MRIHPLALGLASAFLSGRWTARNLVRHASGCLGSRPWWLNRVARRVVSAYRKPPLDSHRALALFISRLPVFAEALADKAYARSLARKWGDEVLAEEGLTDAAELAIRNYLPFAPAMGRMRWPVPALATLGELIDWLGLTAADLVWFADARGWERTARAEKLRHYRYHWIRKANGGLRLVEAPKPRLRAMQRKILHGILDRIPAHAAVAGFRRGGSVLAFAAPHTNQRLVLRMDLADFFVSIGARQVRAVFRTAGYPEPVADALAALCTNTTPAAVFDSAPTQGPERKRDHWLLGRRLATPHLPQGAPTSPALANLCAFRLDVRLAGLAAKLEASYTRYADDLAFSGGESFSRREAAARFLVGRIVHEEGFALRTEKTRAMRQGSRQQLAGVVVNRRPNLPRRELELLEAILTNCVRHGPSSQNREGLSDFRAHLLGRLGWVQMIRPDRAAKLRTVFEKIDWSR